MINNTTMRPNVAYSQANTLNYAINQALLNVNTILPCEILVVNSNGTYDVQSIINYIDAAGNSITPTVIPGVVPYQVRGGKAGLITEYLKNDIVTVGFCQRDISLIKTNWQSNTPPSTRKFNLSDGIIFGYLSNDEPEIYISITSTGINIVSNNQPISINSGTSNTTINCQKATINSNDINLGGVSGAYVLTANTIITAPNGTCTISNPSTTTKAV